MNHPLHHIKCYKAIFTLKALCWIFFPRPTYPCRILFKSWVVRKSGIMMWVTPRSLSGFQSGYSISAPCEGDCKHCYWECSCSNWAQKDYAVGVFFLSIQCDMYVYTENWSNVAAGADTTHHVFSATFLQSSLRCCEYINAHFICRSGI